MKVSYGLTSISIFFLAACSDTPTLEDDLKRYANTVATYTQRVLSVEDVDQKSMEYPRPRLLVHEKQAERISFREFFQLSACELNRLVGEHNSTLNKNQGHSEVLFYNLAFITLADRCLLAVDQPESAMAKMLQRVKLDKEKDLHRLVWNATFASKEFSTFLFTL